MAELGTATVQIVPVFDPEIPRIQILELPSEVMDGNVKTPFVIIVDGMKNEGFRESMATATEALKEATGARGVLVFEDRVAV